MVGLVPGDVSAVALHLVDVAALVLDLAEQHIGAAIAASRLLLGATIIDGVIKAEDFVALRTEASPIAFTSHASATIAACTIENGAAIAASETVVHCSPHYVSVLLEPSSGIACHDAT